MAAEVLGEQQHREVGGQFGPGGRLVERSRQLAGHRLRPLAQRRQCRRDGGDALDDGDGMGRRVPIAVGETNQGGGHIVQQVCHGEQVGHGGVGRVVDAGGPPESAEEVLDRGAIVDRQPQRCERLGQVPGQ